MGSKMLFPISPFALFLSMDGFFACASTSNRPGRYVQLTHRRIAVSGGLRYAEIAPSLGILHHFLHASLALNSLRVQLSVKNTARYD